MALTRGILRELGSRVLAQRIEGSQYTKADKRAMAAELSRRIMLLSTGPHISLVLDGRHELKLMMKKELRWLLKVQDHLGKRARKVLAYAVMIEDQLL